MTHTYVRENKCVCVGSVVVSESLSIETDRPRPKNGVFNSGGYFRFFHMKKSRNLSA